MAAQDLEQDDSSRAAVISACIHNNDLATAEQVRPSPTVAYMTICSVATGEWCGVVADRALLWASGL
jgi:hypothetical protein